MVRFYTAKDYEMVRSWVDFDLPEETLELGSTFIAESDGVPMLVVTVYYLKSKSFALVENFAGDPAHKGEKRRALAKELQEFIEADAKFREVKKLICMAPNEKLAVRYQELGYSVLATGVSCLAKEL